MTRFTVLVVALLLAALVDARADPFIGYNYDKPQCPFVPPQTVVQPTTVTDYRVETVTQYQQQPQLDAQDRYITQYSTVYITSTYNQQVPVYQTVTQTVPIPSPPQRAVTEYQTVTYPPVVSTYISTLVQPSPVYQTITDYETVTVQADAVTLPPQIIYSTIQQAPQVIYETVQLPPQVIYETIQQPPQVIYETVQAPPQVIYSTVQAPPQVVYSTVQRPPQYITITASAVARGCGSEVTVSPDRQYLPPTGDEGFQGVSGYVQRFDRFL